MRCEICGKSIGARPLRTKIDGSVMEVCEDCSKFGKIQKTPPKPKRILKKTLKQKNKKTKQRRRDEPTEELIEDYNSIIRKKREDKGWSREVLGNKINEKVSVINRLESGKMVPDIKLAKKLENILKITLIEKLDDIDLESFQKSSSNGPTLGDIVKIKKK
ncbi:MAG: multiprotein bridging factor aMBF1 [Methanobacteriaceae archaeon]|jgi:putative transcription factor|nr:multiprotein bridging factor aMBF1 [Candidatus Methanorudis spinitermitis]